MKSPLSFNTLNVETRVLKRAGLGLMAFGMFQFSFGQNPEWSEKDLAKSVHRAEQTFKAGEMSRAYGLFAHLVSVSNDRAFLHFRFGAICTHTSQRLNEAAEHLNIARELGILETEHAADWHYYMGRLHHLQYEFDAAVFQLRAAIDASHPQSDWLTDAQLRYGQCMEHESFPIGLVELTNKESLVSHADDFFRLYEMPAENGRLLVVPNHLQSKEDKKRSYSSQLHWLPGQRVAYFSSYGKNGDTGLDIYRVTVDGFGEYGDPIKMPEPINSDFDDCSPICIPNHPRSNGSDRIYFSSDRPQSLGGFDIFSVDGVFTSEAISVIEGLEGANQLPFEINSTADEFLYWENVASGESWLTTNRYQDFEGREVWRFESDWKAVHPVAVTFQASQLNGSGTLHLQMDHADHVLNIPIQSEVGADVLIQEGVECRLFWESHDGVQSLEEAFTIPVHAGPQVLTKPIQFGPERSNSVQQQIDSNVALDESELHWSRSGMANRTRTGLFAEVLGAEELARLKGARMEEISIEKVLQAVMPKDLEGGNRKESVPDWMIAAMREAGLIRSTDAVPATITHARVAALQIQDQMEKSMCWDAPGDDQWKVQNAIERYGEPALAVLSDETRALRNQTAQSRDVWSEWVSGLEAYIRKTGVQSDDWSIMRSFFNAQVQSFDGAVVHTEDMFKRIDSHLRYERWMAEVLPMAVPEFRRDLVGMVTEIPELQYHMRQAAKELVAHEDAPEHGAEVHETLWQALCDSIVAVHQYGVYNLKGMEKPTSWFLRSGGIMDEAAEISNPKERMAKGQQAIGLVWESYRAGQQHYERVIQESQMNPGSWWKYFGPTSDPETQGQSSAYEGYELFANFDDPIISQAQAYQQELDVLRSTDTGSPSYAASLKNALEMRSSMANELNAVFGGENERPDGKVSIKQINESPKQPANASTSTSVKAGSEKVTAPIEKVGQPVHAPAMANSIVPLPESRNKAKINAGESRYTIQIGAFSAEPDFSIYEINFDIIELESRSGMRKFGAGTFSSKEEAIQALQTVKPWVPDAFIKQLEHHGETTAIQQKVAVNSNNSASQSQVALQLPVAKAPAPAAQPAGKQKAFRVKIVEFSGTLPAADIATLLRLGNELDLITTKFSGKTLYFSTPFSSLERAQQALQICLNRGFHDAEIEVVY